MPEIHPRASLGEVVVYVLAGAAVVGALVLLGIVAGVWT